MKKFSKLILFLLIAVSINSCGKLTGIKKLKIGHGLDQSHPVHKAMLYLAERAKEKSNGTLQISVYPSQQLGTERECLELLQIGSLAMTKVSCSVLEGFVPIFKVFSLPYIFRNDEHKFNVFEGDVGKELLLSPEKYWLRGLCFYDAGSRSFYTKDKPINTPDDLVGLKIRTQESATSVKLVNSLGGSATPISWGELYTALQQGVVDGAENNPPSFYLSRHYEVCKCFREWNYRKGSLLEGINLEIKKILLFLKLLDYKFNNNKIQYELEMDRITVKKLRKRLENLGG